MPRSPINNPTDRILRLLEAYESLMIAYDYAAAMISQNELAKLPQPEPGHVTFKLEMQRQGNNYHRARASIMAMRSYRERNALRGGTVKDEQHVSDEDVAWVQSQINKLRPGDFTDKPLSADPVATQLKTKGIL